MAKNSNVLKSNKPIYVNSKGGASSSTNNASYADSSFQRAGNNSTGTISEMDELPNGAMNQGASDTASESVSGDSRKGGLLNHIKEDFEHTKAAMHDASGTISGAKAKAAAEAGASVDKVDKLSDLRKTGGEYLERMGRGNKTLGGAKVGAYMVGASMLTDMLNPFDDD